MIDINIAYDDSDERLGTYFMAAVEDLKNFFADNNSIGTHKYYPSNIAIGDIHNQIENGVKPLIFIVYCHGTEKSLVMQGGLLADLHINASVFNDAIFLAHACSSARELGPSLTEKGTKTYIGYMNDIVTYKINPYRARQINCENSFIKYFITQNTSVSEAIKAQKQYITNQYLKSIEVKDVLFAADMLQMRDSIKVFGDESFKLEIDAI